MGEKRERKLKVERRKKKEECDLERWRVRTKKNDWLMEEILKRTLRREVGIRGIEKRKEKGRRWVIIVELKKIKAKKEMLGKEEEIGRLWRVGINVDLTIEKRKRRWKIIKLARKERAKGKKIEVSNKELRMESRRWIWNEARSWKENEEDE